MVGLTLEESEMTVLNYVRQTYNTKLESLRTLGEDKILAWVMKSGESRKVIEDIACWDEEEDEEDVFGGSNAKSSSSQQAFLSVAEKRDLLENFDLEGEYLASELLRSWILIWFIDRVHSFRMLSLTATRTYLAVEDRTRVFTSALKNVLDSFLIRQESEIMRIPRDLRNQTMSTLNAVWGGDWGKTLQQLKSEVLKERKEEAMQEVVAQVEDKKKRFVILSRTLIHTSLTNNPRVCHVSCLENEEMHHQQPQPLKKVIQVQLARQVRTRRPQSHAD